MAWGVFDKIKNGLKKAGKIFKKELNWVNDNVVQRFKPLAKTIANAFIPGAGTLVDAASDGIDAVAKGNWGGASKSAKDVVDWSKNRFG